MFNHVLCFDYNNQNDENDEFALLIKDTFIVIQNYINVPGLYIALFSLFIAVIRNFKKQFDYKPNLDLCIMYFDDINEAENFIDSLSTSMEYPNNWIIRTKVSPSDSKIDASLIYNGIDNQISINPDLIRWKIFMIIEPVESSNN